LEVEALPVNHPGGAYGYRVTDAGRRFVFIPDNEIEAADPTTPYEEIVAFCRGADVLCHDAQYLDDDMPAKHGWGHSCLRNTCRLAIDAGVRHLVFFHHDPDRTDDQLDAMQASARRFLEPYGIACTAAYEGLGITL
jgi:ribonuclease BN (tRNA processing enzyme)